MSYYLSKLNKGLVGHWTMSQDSLKSPTIIADKTPYGNDGTIYGATFAADRKGKANKAMSFDGVNDYVDCGTPIIPAGDFSISAWCYNEGVISEYSSICGQYTSGKKGRMWFGFQKSAFGYRIGGETKTVSVEYNEHLHCVITREGTTVKVYLNGNLVITRTAVDSIYQGANTIIGSYDSTAGRFNGSIDDVRIYNRALSTEEIKLLYESYNPNLNIGNYFIDPRDGTRYKTVKIGNQIWMAENLKYLPSVSPSNVGSEIDPLYYVYDYQGTDVSAAKATTNYTTHGVLYNWSAALTACPTGWHLPTDAEQHTLENLFATGSCDASRFNVWDCDPAGTALKEGGLSGFNAKMSGSRVTNGSFNYIGSYAYFWSSSAIDSSNAWRRALDVSGSKVYRFNDNKARGFSVRCLRD